MAFCTAEHGVAEPSTADTLQSAGTHIQNLLSSLKFSYATGILQPLIFKIYIHDK